MKVSELNIFPVKSCRGISLDRAEVKARGLEHDRRAMIVDGTGRFISLRSHPKMAQVLTRIEDGALTVSLGDRDFSPEWTSDRISVSVWKSDLDAQLADQKTHSALSEFLDDDLRLVQMDKESLRKTSADWSDSEVSFADGYPVLVTTTGSLAALSKAAGRELRMDQFRSNIVIETNEPWLEDGWRGLHIGDVELDFIKPCSRCVVTTLNPETGIEDRSETMRAMQDTRRSGDPRVKGVLFGWNAIVRRAGMIAVGDTVVATPRAETWPIR